MELAVSKIGQKVCHCFVLHYKNIKIVNSVQVQVARTREGVNILSIVESRARDKKSVDCHTQQRAIYSTHLSPGRWTSGKFRIPFHVILQLG